LNDLAWTGIATAAMKCPDQASRESAAAGDNGYQSFSTDATTSSSTSCCLAKWIQGTVEKTEAHSLTVAIGFLRSTLSGVYLANARSALLNRDAAAQHLNAHITIVVKIKLDRCI